MSETQLKLKAPTVVEALFKVVPKMVQKEAPGSTPEQPLYIFEVEEPLDEIVIEGYASTTSEDRASDVILSTAWADGIKNYLNNPIILAYHDHCRPVGKMVDYSVDGNGLRIKAAISSAAEEVYNLVKAGVLKAFSVSFRVNEASYEPSTDLFVIKALELLEISIVSVPCNQDCTFSLSKSYAGDASDIESFKKSFIVPAQIEQSASDDNSEKSNKELENMTTPTQSNIQAIDVEALVKQVAAASIEASKAASVEVGKTGAELLLADVQKRMEDQSKSFAEVIDGLRSEIAAKADELSKLHASKMEFADKSNQSDVTSDIEKRKAVLLAKSLGKRVEDTNFGRSLIEKAGPHVASASWENTVSTQMEDEIRRSLVIAPLFRQVQMPTPTLMLPINPEAGYGTWVTSAQYGTTASSGSAQTHQLKELTLQSYKLATKEWITNEEDEDAILALFPIINDAIVRRVSKSVDKGLLRGTNTTNDPLKGLTLYQASTSNVTVATTAAVSVANLRALRKGLGTRGLDPSRVIYVVSNDVYYDLLEDTNFMTMDKAGPNATIFTGQIGQINGSPVIVSGEFDTKAGGTAGSIGAIALNADNFIIGNHRGLRLENDYLTEWQQRIIVASLRMAFTQVSTADGQGVSALRWT